MSRSLLLILLGLGGIVMDDASNTLFAQDSYPRVYGPTGRPYGPTQAHYQYERQYGRPWHGGPAPFDPNTGANYQVPAAGWGGYPGYGGYGGYYSGYLPFNGYGYGYQQQGFPLPGGYALPRFNGFSVYQNQYGWGPIVQYQVTPQPVLPQFGPAPTFSWQQPDPFQQYAIQQPRSPQPTQPRVAGRNPAVGPVPEGPLVGAPEPVMQRPHAFMPAEPTTVAQRQKSLHLQGQGDIWFRQQNYLQAYSRYKQAAAAAADLAAPRFRMAYALMALQRFELAVPELQRGIQLDPQYPLTGESPQQVYGEENRLAAAALPQKVAAWVRQDVRSPDRLFLLGALLMISGDQARARILLETAAEFGGPNAHLVAFLRVSEQPAANASQAAPAVDDRPPVPEAVEKMLNENKNWLPAKPLPSRRSDPASAANPPEPEKTPPTAQQLEAAQPHEKNPEPAVPVTPAESQKSAPLKPGYAPIPKKGSETEATVEPTSQEIQPAGETSPADEAGPVIPIPGSGNTGN